MAIKFKPEQQEVIDTQNKNQLVSASAGSGKTTIMIQKIINLITIDKIDIKKILVLTYTKASAEEMKQKLITAINEKVKTDKSLISQIDEVSLADISTIHSFFQKVIKKYFMVLGIDPSFEIIDETAGIKLKQEAFLNAVKCFEQTNESDFLNLLKIYGGSRNLDTIKSLVFELNTFLLSVTNPQNWCDNISTLFYESLDKNLAVEILNKELYERAQHFANLFKPFRQQAINFEEQKFVENLNKIIGVLELVKNDKKFFVENCNAWCNFPATQFRAKDETEELATRIKSVKETMKDYADKVKKWGFDDKEKLEKSLNEMKPIVQALCKLTLLFQDEYGKIKTQSNVFDYDDLEKCMLRLIEIPQIKDELTNHYEKIFVDEYQDANRIQEKIISAICKPNNRFMVGDVKQSIYGFRQAEPDIFLETMRTFESDKQKSAVGYLNYNFRSHNKILNFVNIVFEKIMTVKTSKIDYSTSSIFKWDEGTYKAVDEQNPLPQVEIDIIKRKEKEEKLVPTKIYSVLDEDANSQEKLTDAQLEALFIAKKIDSLLGKKIYVAKKGIEKTIEYRDITILLRSRGNYLDEFCAIITSLGIPLYANTNKSLFEDSDMQLLLNIAKLALNPHNDVALVSVMHSVFAGSEKFSFDELSTIRLSGNSRDEFWKCVDNFKGNDKIVAKIKTLKQTIQNFAFEFENLGGFKAYNNLINKCKFDEDVLGKEDGIQKYEKVKKFVSNFLSNGYNFDLRGFLEFVENNIDDIKAPDYLGGENCVSITTIHSSKGLEYPIVIMGNTGQDFDKNPRTSAIKLNQKFGLGMKYFDVENHTVQTSLPFEAIKKVNKDDDFAEKLRLLYVALTRPQNHLIIVGIQKKDFEVCEKAYDVTRKKSYLDLLVGSLKSSEIEKINLGESISTDEYSVNVILEEKFSYEKPKTEKVYEVDKDCVKIFEDYFNFENKNLKQIKASSSVTALRQIFAENVENFEMEEGESFATNKAEIGTIYHKVLELIDFESTEKLEDVENFLKKNEFCDGFDISAEKILKTIKKIKSFGAKKYLKEQKFAMKFDLGEFDKSLPQTEILVNGIIDLFCVDNNGKNVLIDYKFTEKTNINEITATYKPQLQLYKKACEYAGLGEVDKCFLMLIETGELIEIK